MSTPLYDDVKKRQLLEKLLDAITSHLNLHTLEDPNQRKLLIDQLMDQLPKNLSLQTLDEFIKNPKQGLDGESELTNVFQTIIGAVMTNEIRNNSNLQLALKLTPELARKLASKEELKEEEQKELISIFMKAVRKAQEQSLSKTPRLEPSAGSKGLSDEEEAYANLFGLLKNGMQTVVQCCKANAAGSNKGLQASESAYGDSLGIFFQNMMEGLQAGGAIDTSEEKEAMLPKLAENLLGEFNRPSLRMK